MNNVNLNVIISIAGAILSLLLALLALRKRGGRDRTVRLLLLHLAALTVWQSGLAVLHVRRPDLLPVTFPYAALTLSLLFLQLSRPVLRYGGREWGWWVFGALGLLGPLLIHTNPVGLPNLLWLGDGVILERQVLARDLLLVGWGILSVGTTVLIYKTRCTIEVGV